MSDAPSDASPEKGAIGRWFGSVSAAIFAQHAYTIVLRLTLLIFILHGSSDVGLEVLLMILCGTMLVFPALLQSRVLWMSVCGCVWWLNAVDWVWIDNHKFLMSYWCLACALAVQTSKPGEVLKVNAIALIGLTFLFASWWKIATGEYVDGSFMYFSLLTDYRLELLGTLFGGAGAEVFAEAAAVYETLEEYPEAGASVTLPEHSGLRWFAMASSWWTLVIEGAVALIFLLRFSKFRIPAVLPDLLLIVFIATTYVFIPVIGFGYILAVMGLAACPDERRKTRVVYLLLFALLQVGQLPLDRWLL